MHPLANTILYVAWHLERLKAKGFIDCTDALTEHGRAVATELIANGYEPSEEELRIVAQTVSRGSATLAKNLITLIRKG